MKKGFGKDGVFFEIINVDSGVFLVPKSASYLFPPSR